MSDTVSREGFTYRDGYLDALSDILREAEERPYHAPAVPVSEILALIEEAKRRIVDPPKDAE